MTMVYHDLYIEDSYQSDIVYKYINIHKYIYIYIYEYRIRAHEKHRPLLGL